MKTIANLISVLLLLSGCATGDKNSILPQDGPTMKQVYEGHFNGENSILPDEQTASEEEDEGSTQKDKSVGQTAPIKRRTQTEHPSDLTGYTRSANNEIQQIFPRLRNQTLVMYIFPHLSQRERHPIPGYSTAFTLYERVEYALPGELMEGH